MVNIAIHRLLLANALSEVTMRVPFRFLLISLLSVLTVSASLFAQAPTAGSRDQSGRILTKIVVTMNEPGAFGRPATGLAFLVVAEDGDRVSVKTNEAGVASTWLAPGNYRFVTPDALNWEGFAYTWDRVIPVTTRTSVIQLTQDDARSIAIAGTTGASVPRTSEPAALSSQPVAWKASVPATRDLRVTAAVPATGVASSQKSQPQQVERSSDMQPRQRLRKGAWFNLGTGYGVASCQTCSDYFSGYSGGLTLGGTISPRLRIGLGTASWVRYEEGVSVTVGTVDARIRFYPSTTGGFFLTAGLGAGMIGADLADYGSAAEFGFGSVGGLGWDLPVASSVNLTPFWNGFAILTSNTNVSVGQIGLGITIHQ